MGGWANKIVKWIRNHGVGGDERVAREGGEECARQAATDRETREVWRKRQFD